MLLSVQSLYIILFEYIPILAIYLVNKDTIAYLNLKYIILKV